jgi:hypothetical protein
MPILKTLIHKGPALTISKSSFFHGPLPVTSFAKINAGEEAYLAMLRNFFTLKEKMVRRNDGSDKLFHKNIPPLALSNWRGY